MKRVPSGRASGWPPDGPFLFVDRCAWSRRLGDALQAAGIPFIAHRGRFKHDAPDQEWLAVAAAEQWIVLTRDKNIRRKPDEIDALLQGDTVAFILSAGNASAADTAALIVQIAGRMYRRALGAKRPAIFTIGMSGDIRALAVRRSNRRKR